MRTWILPLGVFALSFGLSIGCYVPEPPAENTQRRISDAARIVNADGSTSSPIAPGSQAQGDVLPHKRESSDFSEIDISWLNERPATVPVPAPRARPLSERMGEAMAQTEIQTCYAFIRQSLAGTGSTARFRSFLDGAGMQHLGGGKLFLRSFAYITRADSSTVEMHYDCTAEDGTVQDFTVR